MKSTDALVMAWEKTLSRKANAPAIFDTQGAVVRTFRGVEENARAIQETIAPRAKGELFPIDIGNRPEWPAMLLACLREGLLALPIDSSATEEQRAAARKISVRGCGEKRPTLLKVTSGTTAAPRAIRFRSEQLLVDCEQICDTMEITERDINFAVIPLSHSYGFSNVITPMIIRGVPFVISRDRMPRAVLDDLARTHATVFPGMPVFYQSLCEMGDLPALSHLRLCVSAGAPLPRKVAQTFREKFGLSIHSFYGSSECGGICYDRAAALVEEGFIGEPMVGVNLRLLDPGATSSQVEVRSAAAGDGYLPEPDDKKLRTGRFVPDDLLTTSGDGFRIVGRVSDVINVAGKKVSPAEVEAILLQFDGIREAVVFGKQSTLRNEEVAACVVAEKEIVESELLDFCRSRLTGWQ
ncbi:MAG: acyl--CoA ligase, partial [Verrucomicrobiota bacterium]|nr:acyl--CoA ligase [Verrucomicrobiota bacterium]